MESPSPAGGGERYREHNVIRLESILVQLGGILNSGLFSIHAQSVVVVDNDDDDDDGHTMMTMMEKKGAQGILMDVAQQWISVSSQRPTD